MANKHSRWHPGGKERTIDFSYEGRDYTIGVLESGVHKCYAERYTQLMVLVGNLFDHRDRQVRGDPHCPDKLPQFRPGDEVVLSCHFPVAFLCYYSDVEFSEA